MRSAPAAGIARTQGTAGTATPPARHPLRGPARAAEVPLRYLGSGSVRVRGAASGRVYMAPAHAPSPLLVDSRDVAALVRTGYFAR